MPSAGRTEPRSLLSRAGALLLALAAVPVHPAPVSAQEVRSVRFVLDNDLFGLRGREAPPDHDYTHGVNVSVELSGAPRVVRWAVPAAELSTMLGLGQEVYTPREDAPEPVPGERPYAAWLYLAAGASADRGHRRDEVSVRLGVVGPPALGEEVQNGVHRLTGSRPQLGWEHQIGTRPGIVLRFEQTHRLRPLPDAGWVLLLPAWSAAAGNVEAGLGAGARVRVGAARGAYALVGARGEHLLWDVFLDAAESTVERIPSVGEWEAGAGWAFRRATVEYRFVARGREYRTQAAPHRWGSLGLSWHPGRSR
ncbi:MAG TPA: lipid A deacylase LpxR family protein [Longimicrobiaceae bacterium]|nr:lipid A deacylase LpxR family protein [Longimicrobiaceae bacterium]